MANNVSSGASLIRKLIFYNKKNKKILIIDGTVWHQKLEAIVYLKPHMVLYGVVKMICMEDDGIKSEYGVVGIDKMVSEDPENISTTAYKIYLSKLLE